MFEKLNKKIKSILTGVDSNTLEQSLETVSHLMETEEGQNLINQFSSLDKEELMQKFDQMDEEDIINKLDSIDPKEFSEKFNDAEKENLAKLLKENPALINNFDKFINKN